MGIPEGLMTMETAAAHDPGDCVAFGGPEEPFRHMGYHSWCPGLRIGGKRALIASVIAGMLRSPVYRSSSFL